MRPPTNAEMIDGALVATEEQLREWVHLAAEQMKPDQLRHLMIHIITACNTNRPN